MSSLKKKINSIDDPINEADKSYYRKWLILMACQPVWGYFMSRG